VGANSFVIGKTLGHKNQQATAIYARVSKDIARSSMEEAVNAMLIYK
jgi:predicted site-specific integrase-resolvase